jgi:tol-pal system protein YbgF
MSLHRLVRVLAVAALLSGAAAVAHGQDEPPDAGLRERLDRLEKQLHEVREIVLQARSTGQPVEIKEAGPDPQVVALQSKFDDLDQTLRSLNGEVDNLTHQVQLAHGENADDKAAVAALADRVDKLEKALAAATAPPPTPAAGDQGPGPNAGPAPGPEAGDPKAAYAHAHQLLMNGDYPAAQAAYQDYVDHYGDTAQAPQARYWLGETKYVQGDYAGAAAAYIGATRGWPQTPWAADAVVKLSLSLIQLNRPKDACAALAEFSRHYAKGNPAAKGRADAARIKAKCDS